MSVSLHVNLREIEGLGQRIDALGKFDRRELLDLIGSEGENQTRRRIAYEKTSPDGEQWPEWSERYAKTRHAGQSLLQSQGYLLDSQTYNVITDSTVEWGSNLVYARTHQKGDPDRNIVARQYLGLNNDNLNDIAALVDDFVDDHIKRSLQ